MSQMNNFIYFYSKSSLTFRILIVLEIFPKLSKTLLKIAKLYSTKYLTKYLTKYFAMRNISQNIVSLTKSHGHDRISIRMIKMCDKSILKPLMIIFRNCLNDGIFPMSWKKANITPIHKKGDKCTISNYRPISVLPIC